VLLVPIDRIIRTIRLHGGLVLQELLPVALRVSLEAVLLAEDEAERLLLFGGRVAALRRDLGLFGICKKMK
jgi:hypothetical protein